MPTSFEIADAARASIAGLLDLQLAPLGLAAINELAPTQGETILDVGCGAGGTTIQLAECVGPTGHVIGVDIGPRSILVAQSRTKLITKVTLREEDASTLNLADHSLDAIYSRFGVMFFESPHIAFANFRRMLHADGRLAFVCWRSLSENELDMLPLKAAGVAVEADDTPFSFAAAGTIRELLQGSGFTDISVRKFDAPVTCGDLNETVKVTTTVGALGKVLRDNPELSAAAIPRVREALKPRQSESGVYLQASTWVVSARVKAGIG